MGLINDIPTVAELVSRIIDEAGELITGRLADSVAAAQPTTSSPAATTS